MAQGFACSSELCPFLLQSAGISIFPPGSSARGLCHCRFEVSDSWSLNPHVEMSEMRLYLGGPHGPRDLVKGSGLSPVPALWCGSDDGAASVLLKCGPM